MGDWKSTTIGWPDAEVIKRRCVKISLSPHLVRDIRGKIYQSDFYRAGFNAIPRQAREQDSIDTPSFYSSGSVNQKVEPEPFTESTPIVPFKLSMMVLLIVSPSPVPCLNSFILMKRSNMRLRSSSEIPIPVSCSLRASNSFLVYRRS